MPEDDGLNPNTVLHVIEPFRSKKSTGYEPVATIHLIFSSSKQLPTVRFLKYSDSSSAFQQLEHNISPSFSPTNGGCGNSSGPQHFVSLPLPFHRIHRAEFSASRSTDFQAIESTTIEVTCPEKAQPVPGTLVRSLLPFSLHFISASRSSHYVPSSELPARSSHGNRPSSRTRAPKKQPFCRQTLPAQNFKSKVDTVVCK